MPYKVAARALPNMATHHSTTVFQNSCHVREQVRNSVVGSKTFMLNRDKFIVTQNRRDRSLLYCYTGMNTTCSEHSAPEICPVIWTGLLTGCHVHCASIFNRAELLQNYLRQNASLHIPCLAVFQSENIKGRVVEVLHYALFRLLPVLNLSLPLLPTPPPPPYLLTPWCRVLLEKLTGLQLVKKFPAFYGTRRFITALTSVRHLSLSWANPIQSTYPHPTSWRSIIILFTHLRLGLPSGSFPPVSPPRPYTPPSPRPLATHALPISFFSILSPAQY